MLHTRTVYICDQCADKQTFYDEATAKLHVFLEHQPVKCHYTIKKRCGSCIVVYNTQTIIVRVNHVAIDNEVDILIPTIISIHDNLTGEELVLSEAEVLDYENL